MAENKAITHFTPDREKKELTVERTFNAPRQLVWKAWTEPERLAQWWAPKGWTTTIHELDLRPGGVWHYCMHGPDGMQSCGKTYYREIVEPERLVYLDTFVDTEGNLIEGLPQLNATTEFTELNGKTKITSRTKFAVVEDLETLLGFGMEQGLTESWDALEAHLANA